MANEERDAAERLADHAAIDALADELIPALIAKLGASGLGEIEVREGAWKVRLRRPADGTASGPSGGRRGGERAGRGGAAAGAAVGAAVGAGRPVLTPVGPGRQASGLEDGDGRAIGATAESGGEAGARGRDPFRAIATSPAVGFYQPRPGIVPGLARPDRRSRSARSTSWASRPRSSRRPTASSGRAWSSRARPSSTARSSSGSSSCRAPAADVPIES